jgi:hypothetical protein
MSQKPLITNGDPSVNSDFFHISAICQRNVSANRRGKEIMRICMNATWNMVALSSSQWNRWLKYLRNVMDIMNLLVLSNLAI